MNKKIKINKYLLIFILETLLFLPYLFRGPVASDSSDDLAMNLIASGAFGTGSQYLVYSSILYGYLLKAFYLIVPEVNWYLTMQFLLNFAAVTSILLCLASFLSERRALCASLILHFYFALEFYEKQQFSQNASLYALAGFILIFTALWHKENAKKYRIAAVVMLVFSALVRFECLLLMLPFGGLFLLAALLKDEECAAVKGFRQKLALIFKKWRRDCFVLFATLLFCLCIFVMDQLVFWQKPEWKAYKEYHWDGVIPLLDVDGAPEFDPQALADTGLTSEDIYLFYLYQYADMDYFSVDRLKALAAARTATGAPAFGESMLERFKELYRFPKHYNDEYGTAPGIIGVFSFIESLAGWNIIFLLLLLLPLLLRKEKRGFHLAFLALFFAVFLAETVFLVLRGHAPRRVLLGSRCAVELFTAFLFLSSLRQPENNSNEKRQWLLPILILLVAEVFSIRLCWHAVLPEYTRTKQSLDSLRSLSKEPEPGQSHTADSVFYLLDANFLWAERMGIPDPREISMTAYKDYFRPFILSGGWIAECPHNLHYYKEAGIDDPVMELLENELMSYIVRGYSADVCEAWMQAHLSKRSGREIKADTAFSSDSVRILRFE